MNRTLVQVLLLFAAWSSHAQSNATITIEYADINQATQADYADFLDTEVRILQSGLFARRVEEGLDIKTGDFSMKANRVDGSPTIRCIVSAHNSESVALEYLKQYYAFRFMEVTCEVVRVSFVPAIKGQSTSELVRLESGSTSLYSRVLTTNLAFSARIKRAMLNGSQLPSSSYERGCFNEPKSTIPSSKP